jgi:hypothetical protein
LIGDIAMINTTVIFIAGVGIGFISTIIGIFLAFMFVSKGRDNE